MLIVGKKKNYQIDEHFPKKFLYEHKKNIHECYSTSFLECSQCNISLDYYLLLLVFLFVH